MGILSSIFGTPKVIDAVADTVKSGVGMLDNAFYTEQEKAANNAKMMDLWLEIQKTTASENSIRSITRRYLAWVVMGTYVLIVLMACVVWKSDPAWAEYILSLLTKTNLSYLALIVGFFYFGSYAIGQYIGGKK
jgi:hypothetical protein